VRELSARFPQYTAQIEAYDRRWAETVVGPIQPTVDLLYRLKSQGYTLHGLSNWSQEKFELMCEKYAFFELFETIVISGNLRLVKPDPRIYQELLVRIKRRPQECLFIDDAPKNIQAAQSLGFNAIQYQSPDQLITDLAKFGIT
jgi:HAD superfamily hydrolase (TIGR01509 family)